MDATERERLAALAEAATPGPWVDPDVGDGQPHYGDFGYHVYGCPAGETEDSPQGMADAAYIAAADPSTILALLAALDDAEAEVEAARRVAWRIALSLKDVEPVEELPKGYDIEEAWARFSSRVDIERLNAANAPAERDRYRRQVEAVRALHADDYGFCSFCGDNYGSAPYPCATVRALDGAES